MDTNTITPAQKRSAVIVGISTSFITAFAGSALNLAIPDMGAHFNMGAASVGWLVTAYSLIIAAFSVPFGKIADTTSRRNVLLAGIVTFGLASILAIFSPNTVVILLARIFQAFGSAMIFATNMPVAISVFPPNERGKAIGIVTSGVYVGLSLGPVLGGVLNSNFGWKSIFVFGAIVSVFALFITAKGLSRDATDSKKAMQDFSGNVIYVFMIASFIYGLTSLNSQKFGILFIIASIILGFVFVKNELKVSDPMIDVRIFASNRTYTLSNITALFNYSATFGLGYLTSIYLQVVLGLSSQVAGFVLITQPFFMAILSPKMGKLSDKVAPYKLASSGMGLCALSLLTFVFIGENTPLWFIIIALAVAGIGIALFSSPNTNVVMSCVHPSKFAVANSILSTMRTTGQSAGMAIITIVVSATVGNASLYEIDAASLITTVHISFLIFTMLCVAGIFMSLQRAKDI